MLCPVMAPLSADPGRRRARGRRAGLRRLRRPRGSSSPRTTRTTRARELFDEHCAGCHTLDVAGTEGSATNVKHARAQGRPELQPAQGDRGRASSTRSATAASPPRPMPQNIVTGEDAQKVADFVAKYSGTSGREQLTGPPPAEPAAACSTSAIRREPGPVRAALARRRDGSDARLDERAGARRAARELLPEVEGLRARQNEASQGDRRAPSRRAATRPRRSRRCRRSPGA